MKFTTAFSVLFLSSASAFAPAAVPSAASTTTVRYMHACLGTMMDGTGGDKKERQRERRSH